MAQSDCFSAFWAMTQGQEFWQPKYLQLCYKFQLTLPEVWVCSLLVGGDCKITSVVFLQFQFLIKKMQKHW